MSTVYEHAPERAALLLIWPEATQDTVEVRDAAELMLKSDWILIDFDDTIATHDPRAQYWTALHTLAIEHGEEGQFPLDQFAQNYNLTSDDTPPDDVEEIREYISEVRKLSAKATGDEFAFERVANAFIEHSNDGNALKQAIKVLPTYNTSIGQFWEARASLIKESGVSPAFGKQLMPGISDLLTLLNRLGKQVAVISNSRSDLVVPALDELLPRGAKTFTEIITLGDSDLQPKPERDAYEDMRQRHDNIHPGNTIYVGNAREDAHFADNLGVPAIILGEPFEAQSATSNTQFIPNASVLSRILRRHTEGATISFRGAPQELSPEYDSQLVSTMTPEQLRAIARTGLRSFWDRHLTQSVGAYESSAWGNDYLSLKHVPDFATAFGGIMGEIVVDTLPGNPTLAAYFSAGRSHRMANDKLSLRGEPYFVVVDPRYETATERVHAMTEELLHALVVVEQVDRRALQPTELLAYIGVLDNAKQQAISLFNAVTYNERNNGIPDSQTYLQLRQELLGVAIATTRSFYQACLGRDFTTPVTASEVSALSERLIPLTEGLPLKGFKLQELDHPLKIMLASHNIAQQDFDTTVGFPSGGTQLAIAAAQANEILHRKAPGTVDVVVIPLSLHSGTKKGRTVTMTDDVLKQSIDLFANTIEGRRVMIVDDNSSTGSTIERGSTAILSFQPSSLDARVGEIDPQRMIIRAKNAQDIGQEALRAVDLRHSVFSTAAGVVPISSRDVQLRKEHAGRVLNLRSNWNTQP